MTDVRLLLSELSEILPLNYHVVKDICKVSIRIIESLMLSMRENVPKYDYVLWLDFHHLSEILNLLKASEKIENN